MCTNEALFYDSMQFLLVKLCHPSHTTSVCAGASDVIAWSVISGSSREFPLPARCYAESETWFVISCEEKHQDGTRREANFKRIAED